MDQSSSPGGVALRHNTARKSKPLLYKLSYVFLLAIALGLVLCTAVDIIPQSFSNGQFWNAIIVFSAFALRMIVGLVLNIIRIVKSRRWLIHTPRNYMVGPQDMNKATWAIIQKTRRNCQSVFVQQFESSAIDHPGLQNPLITGELQVEGPYYAIVETMPSLFEQEVLNVDATFSRSEDQDFRSYIEAIMLHRLVASQNDDLMVRFCRLYEEARFSGRHITEAQLFALMSAFCDATYALVASQDDLSSRVSSVDSPDMYMHPSPRSFREIPAIRVISRNDSSAGRSISSNADDLSTRSVRSSDSGASMETRGSVIVRPADGDDWLASVARQETISSAFRRASAMASETQLTPVTTRGSVNSAGTVLRHR